MFSIFSFYQGASHVSDERELLVRQYFPYKHLRCDKKMNEGQEPDQQKVDFFFSLSLSLSPPINDLILVAVATYCTKPPIFNLYFAHRVDSCSFIKFNSLNVCSFT